MSDLNEDRVKALIDAAIKQHTEAAFHEGDVHGHRRAHRLQIDDHRARSKLKEDVLSKIITGGAWALVVAVVYAVWAAIKSEVHK